MAKCAAGRPGVLPAPATRRDRARLRRAGPPPQRGGRLAKLSRTSSGCQRGSACSGRRSGELRSCVIPWSFFPGRAFEPREGGVDFAALGPNLGDLEGPAGAVFLLEVGQGAVRLGTAPEGREHQREGHDAQRFVLERGDDGRPLFRMALEVAQHRESPVPHLVSRVELNRPPARHLRLGVAPE
jgi:hypothetical protein